MKKLLMMAAFALLSSANAYSQFANTNGSQAKKISSTANTAEWSSVYIQWNPSNFAVDVKGADDQSFTAFTLGFNKAFGVMKSQPLFVEVGGALQYSFYSEDWDDDDEDWDDYDVPQEKFGMLSLKVPVSLTYNWQVSDNVAIAPYAGLTARFNIIGSRWIKFDEDFMDDLKDYNRDYYEEFSEMEESKNIFDKKDMGSKDATANRFQLGWQIGVNVKFNNKWYIGAAYGSDFSEFSKKTKISQPSITAGILF